MQEINKYEHTFLLLTAKARKQLESNNCKDALKTLVIAKECLNKQISNKEFCRLSLYILFGDIQLKNENDVQAFAFFQKALAISETLADIPIDTLKNLYIFHIYQIVFQKIEQITPSFG